MAVIISDMDMPKKCGECRLCYHDDYFTGNTDNYRCVLFPGYPKDLNLEGKVPNCPLREIPKGHGRLIDANTVDKSVKDPHQNREVMYWINNAPTIIEAESEESEDKE